MNVKLIGRIINSECYQLICNDRHGITGGPVWYIDKLARPIFHGDNGLHAHLGIYEDEATARSEFKLICAAAKQYGRG